MKSLKILFIFLLIVSITSCNKDDDKVVVEETPNNSGPSEIRVVTDLGNTTTFKFEYTSFNKISKVVETTGTEVTTEVLTYNAQQKIATLQYQDGSGTSTTTYLYDTSGKIIGVQDEYGTIPITQTPTGFIVTGTGFGSGEYFFTSAGQLTKYTIPDGTLSMNITVDTAIRGPFYDGQIDPILTNLFNFFRVPVQGITSVQNLIFFNNAVFTNTVDDNGVLSSTFIKFEENDPSSPTETITYTY